jgi:two-component system sensor histidine kinase DesK
VGSLISMIVAAEGFVMPKISRAQRWRVLAVRAAPASAGHVAGESGEDGWRASASQKPSDRRSFTWMIFVLLTCLAAVTTVRLADTPVPARWLALGVGLPCLGALFALTIWITSPAVEGWRREQRLAVLLACALVAYPPMIPFGQAWAVMAGVFAGIAPLLLSGWAGWTLFGLAVGGTFAGTLFGAIVLSDLSPDDVATQTLCTLALGLAVFGLLGLSLLVTRVRARHEELVQLAIIRERMRFARDLHDLLGYSLSTITLKAEVTRRLVSSDPARTRDELAEIIDIARQALADVRAVSSGYRNISLAKEASAVASLLCEAGIDAQVSIDFGPLSETVDTVLATVLRETVTNMLQHSSARHCVIEAGIRAGTIHLHIANDGVPRSAAQWREHGGLDNLKTRMAAIGGQLRAQIRPDGWFDVLAECHADKPFSRAAP